MPKHLVQSDIDALKITLGYQTGPVAVDREVVDELIKFWQYHQPERCHDAECTCTDCPNHVDD